MQDLVFGEAGGVEDQGVGRGCEGRGCARTITAVAFTQLNRGFGRHSAQMLLLQSPLFADYRVGIQEDFTSASGKTLVAMSRPSITTPPPVPISRWRCPIHSP